MKGLRGAAARWRGLSAALVLAAPSRLPATGLAYRSESRDLPEAQTWIVALLVCGLALAGLVFLARRGGGVWWRSGLSRRPQQGAPCLVIVETRRVTPQVQLMVVDFEGQRLLLSVAGSQVQKVEGVPVPERERPQEAQP